MIQLIVESEVQLPHHVIDRKYRVPSRGMRLTRDLADLNDSEVEELAWAVLVAKEGLDKELQKRQRRCAAVRKYGMENVIPDRD